MNKIYSLFLVALLLSSCSSKPSKNVSKEEVINSHTSRLPPILAKGIMAHGGIEKWNAFQTVSYELQTSSNNQEQIIDLHTRKVRITDSLFVLGYDGDQVWVSPNLKSFGNGSPRFYHNLYFYFFAMPYVLTDSGIKYEDLGEQTIAGKTYHAVKVSYDEGVGDSSEDFYIAHFNPKTGLMELLLYTVTYFTKESNKKYNALFYDWQEVNGLQVAKSIKGYKYDSGRLGDFRYEAFFNDVKFSKKIPSEDLFSIPHISEIDSLK